MPPKCSTCGSRCLAPSLVPRHLCKICSSSACPGRVTTPRLALWMHCARFLTHSAVLLEMQYASAVAHMCLHGRASASKRQMSPVTPTCYSRRRSRQPAEHEPPRCRKCAATRRTAYQPQPQVRVLCPGCDWKCLLRKHRPGAGSKFGRPVPLVRQTCWGPLKLDTRATTRCPAKAEVP